MSSAAITLNQGKASATLLPERGGLMTELVLPDNRGRTASLLWMPKNFASHESGWPGGGLPICFPFAGRVFHEGQPFHYEIGDAVRPMAIHGFAYAMPWRVVRQTPTTAELELVDSDATHKLYPFRFNLLARFELSATSLKLSLRATHIAPQSNAERMPVAFGLHPYFTAPMGSGSLAKCRLETSATSQYRVTPSGGAGKAEPFPQDNTESSGRLDAAVFGNLILGKLIDRTARLVDDEADLAMQITWSQPAPTDTSGDNGYLVLWTKPGQGFHCIEPWMGLPDAVNNGQGVRWLKAGEAITQDFEIALVGR